MKNFYIYISLGLIIVAGTPVNAQLCDPITPVYYVDLTGQPSGVWISPNTPRAGSCCGATAPDICIQFVVTLDSSANGIKFDILSGAVPPGALYYQVGCGTPVQVGQPLCLNGPGPHHLTFCKPGNNSNVYGITSLPQPSTYGSEWVSQACVGTLGVAGLVTSSIIWTSIPANPLHNSFLSCTTGCTQVTVAPSGANVPAYIDYQVCGYVIGGCFPYYYCDTMRVNFVNNLAVAITPQNHVICYGMPDITITANTTGGLAPFSYLWSTGETTQSITVGPGTYTVQLRDSMSCSTAYDTVVVYGVPSMITANAGPDQVFCTNQQSVALNGSIQTASGGTWSGGSGSYSPGANALNAVYTPSQSEILSGSAQLVLTTTGNMGCPAESDTILITISPSPAPSIAGNTNVCEFSTHVYTAAFTSGITYNWSVSGGTIISNNQNSITVAWGNNGTGYVSLTEINSLLCDSTVNITVTINPNPAPVINGPLIACTASTSQYTLSNTLPGSTYAWHVTGGTIIGPANSSLVNISWITPGNAVLSVTETNSYGCNSLVQFPISILAIPTPAITGSVNGCAGQIITYSTPLVPGNTYNWNITGGSIITNSNNSVTVHWPSATTGTVSLTESNTMACYSTVISNIIIGPQPMPSISGSGIVCTGSTLTYSIQNPVAGENYNWSVTGGSILGSATTSSVQIFWTVAGQGVVSVNQSNSFGCDSTVMLPVTILTMPAPSISGMTSACSGYFATYTTPLVSGNTYAWSVAGGNIINNTGNSIMVQWPAAVNGTVTLTESNTLACDSTVTLNIGVSQQPSPIINGPQLICTNDYANYFVTTPVTGNSYAWNVTGGSIIGPSNGTTINVMFTMAGIQSITLTETNNFGCDSTITFLVDVRLKPNPSLTGLPVNCEGDRSVYSVQNFTGHTFIWTVTGGSIVGTAVGNSIEVLWMTPGQGDVEVRVASPLGCDSLVSMPVLVNPLPAPVISGPVEMCEKESANYSTVFSGLNTYSWTVTNASITGVPTSNFVTLWFSNPGNVTLTLTETTPMGCYRQVPLQIQVHEKPKIAINGNGVGCISNQEYTYNSNLQPGVDYQWSVSGGTITSGSGTPAITVQWTNPGVQSITLTAINQATGCDSSFTINVMTGSLPPPVISAASMNGCVPVSMNFSGNMISAQYNYTWNFGDGQTGFGPNPSHQYVNPGTYTIQLIATNHTGCADTTFATVIAHPNPVSNFNMFYGSDIYYATLSNLVLINNSTGANQYQWNFGNGDTSHQFEPDYSYQIPGNYPVSLLVTNQYGCTDISTKYIEVKVPELIYIPNAFTPNNDAINDYFNVSGLNITSLSVLIFNRWGHNIFSSSNPSFQWDGTYNGKAAPEGVYVYKIAAVGFHGERYNLDGTVTLVR